MALLAMSLLVCSAWHLEATRRTRLAARHFCTCSDCCDLAVWSEQADRIYGMPLHGLLAIDVVLRLASGVALSAGLLAAGGGWLLFRVARDANVCANCHYDRTGLPAGAVCPECGSAAFQLGPSDGDASGSP
ncbi:MAG TPA: hypothetical protein VFF69_15815 [Phycisphaerales bacterium]|nr:hypothetical protein [Phycisphaerales bacterium]